MEYRHLGRSGLIVSAVGLGTNNFGRKLDMEGARAVVDEALDQGVTFIDTADVYGGDGASETIIGKLIGSRRDGVIIATKFGNPMGEAPHRRGASRRWIMQAAEASLRRLQTDHIDLYQIHVPDPETPIEETLRALDDLVREGKVRYVGHSNFAGWQIADAHWVARTGHLAVPISEQSHYNLLAREIEREVIPACQAFGVGVIPYFPLASGFLTGKYRQNQPPPVGRILGTAAEERLLRPENFDLLERLEGFASEAGHSLLELAFGFLLSQPEVGPVIASASSPEHVHQNVASADWRLRPDEVSRLREILAPS